MRRGGAKRSRGATPVKIGCLVEAIQPAVEKVKNQTGDLVDNAVRENINRGATAPSLSGKVDSGELLIAGMYYDLDTGEVTLQE